MNPIGTMFNLHMLDDLFKIQSNLIVLSFVFYLCAEQFETNLFTFKLKQSYINFTLIIKETIC